MASRAGEAAGCPRVGNSVGELVVAVERPEFIGDAEAEGSLGEGGVGDALGLFGIVRKSSRNLHDDAATRRVMAVSYARCRDRGGREWRTRTWSWAACEDGPVG